MEWCKIIFYYLCNEMKLVYLGFIFKSNFLMFTILLLFLSIIRTEGDNSCLEEFKGKTFEFEIMKTLLNIVPQNIRGKIKRLTDKVGLVVCLTVGEDLSFTALGAITIFSFIDSDPLFTLSNEFKLGKDLVNTKFKKETNKCTGLLIDLVMLQQVIQEESEGLKGLGNSSNSDIRTQLQNVLKLLKIDGFNLLENLELNEYKGGAETPGLYLSLESDGKSGVTAGSFEVTNGKTKFSFELVKEIKNKEDLLLKRPARSFSIYDLLIIVGLVAGGILVGYLLSSLIMKNKRQPEGLITAFNDEHNVMLS